VDRHVLADDFGLCGRGAGRIANVERPAAFKGAVVSFLQRHFPVR
jgi:hypothetical protein